MDDHKRKYSKQEAAAPIVRRRQPGLDLKRAIHADVQRNVGPNGVFPQYLYWRRDSMDADCYQEIMTAPGGVLVARALELIYGGHGISQLIFGVDVQEPKSLSHGAGVILGFFKGGGTGIPGTWDVGVIHYRYQPRIVTPIDWNHPASTNYMHSLILLYDRKYRLGRAAMARRLGPFNVEK